MGTKLDKIQSVLEYAIAAVFIIGGFSLLFAEPITSVSPILNLLGTHTAGHIYTVWFVAVGVWLMYAKLKKRRKHHRRALMAAYLTAIFTVVLEFFLLGWTWFLLDGIIMALLAGVFWLRFKIQTEYLSGKEVAHYRREAKRLGS